MSAPSAHLTDLILERLAEGELPAAEAAEAHAHLEGCARCGSVLESYEALFGMLRELPRFAPSAAFADGVMARVRVAPREHLVVVWLRKLMPTTRRGWALVCAAVTAPAVPLLALLAWLLTQPLLTPATLGQWALIRGQAAVQGIAVTALEVASAAGVFGWAEAVYAAVRTVPGTALGGAVFLLAIAIPLSAWSLVRLTRTPSGNVTYAN